MSFLFSKIFGSAKEAAAQVTAPAAAQNSSVASAPVPAAAPVKTSSRPADGKPGLFTSAEIAVHNKDDDCWIIIHGKVYDVTEYIPEHPGGAIIAQDSGKDSTAGFEDTGHSNDARKLLEKYYIGDLVK